MELRSLDFKDGLPTGGTFHLSIEEVHALAKMTGRLSGTKAGEEIPSVDYSHICEIYSCVTGDVFNSYWDDGVNDYERQR